MEEKDADKFYPSINSFSPTDRQGDLHVGNGTNQEIKLKSSNSLYYFESDELLGGRKRVSPETAVKLRYAAIAVSWVSVIGAFIQGVFALVSSSIKGSATLFGFGLDALLDSASSIIVLWRFYDKELYSEKREQRACVFIGICLLFSSLFLLGKTVFALLIHLTEEKSLYIWMFSLVNGIINIILASVKVTIGYFLESRSLIIDSVITFIGSMMSFGALVALALYIANNNLWFIDSIFGLFGSAILMVSSFRLLYENTDSRKK